MADRPAILVTQNQCAPEQEEKFNRWYNEVHIPMLLKSRDVRGVTRYKLSSCIKGECTAYLTVYEFRDPETLKRWLSGPEVAASREEREESWGHDNFETRLMASYEAIKSFRK